jgi:hypothetical protein
VAAVFAVGLALFVVGYIGLLFGRLIKAAVSRQREFLADASSVQFTRNPDGIAGALDQISAASQGALIGSRYAEDLSHMFFGQSVKLWFGGLLDTHPATGERIKRVHPGFRASNYRKVRASPVPAPDAEAEEAGAGKRMTREQAATAVLTAASVLPGGRRGADLGAQWGRSASDSAKLVGTLDGGKVDYAARLLNALPPALRDKLRDKDGARAALVALLLAAPGTRVPAAGDRPRSARGEGGGDRGANGTDQGARNGGPRRPARDAAGIRGADTGAQPARATR